MLNKLIQDFRKLNYEQRVDQVVDFINNDDDDQTFEDFLNNCCPQCYRCLDKLTKDEEWDGDCIQCDGE